MVGMRFAVPGDLWREEEGSGLSVEMVRVVEIPDCKMVSSGIGMFGQEHFERFERWFSAQKPSTYPRDYLFWDGVWGESGGFHWLYQYEAGMEVPDEFPIIDFAGGLYAVVTGIDGQSNAEEMEAVRAFMEAHGFARDPSREELGNVITPKAAAAALGYSQMDYFTPMMVKRAQ